jgi:hypothetical protein
MRNRFFLLCSGVWWLLLLAAFALPSSGQQIETQIAGRGVSFELVKNPELTPEAWPAEQVRPTLDTVEVTFKTSDRLSTLLSGNGIRPDGEAYTLFYELNPAITKASNIAAGTKLVLPKLNGGYQLQTKLKGGYFVLITVDPVLKNDLRSNAKVVADSLPAFLALAETRFENTAERPNTLNFVREISTWLQHVRQTLGQRTAPPLRHETLFQLNAEAGQVKALVQKAIAPEGKLSTDDQEQIKLIRDDVRLEIGRWDNIMSGELPVGEPKFKVTITISGNDPGLISTLRVYYVVSGAFRNPPNNPPVVSRPFDGLGSGSSKDLTIKNYKIWAARDGDPGRPLTPITLLEVRQPSSGNQLTQTLSLAP